MRGLNGEGGESEQVEEAVKYIPGPRAAWVSFAQEKDDWQDEQMRVPMNLWAALEETRGEREGGEDEELEN